MEIVTVQQRKSQVKLKEGFLAPYHRKGDPFLTLLARSTYLTKYCRGGTETWTDTIRRVVEGNVNQALNVTEREAEQLFHLFWTGQALPPGRGLWTGGVEGIPADARYNCWNLTLRTIDDWCWTANQLMLGGGVGVVLNELDSMPIIAKGSARFAIWCRKDHPDLGEVNPEGPEFLNGSTPVYIVEDSREGWVEALRRTLTAAYEGKDLVIDVSKVRSRGSLIHTFGGIACGPGPLTTLLRFSWKVIRKAVSRKLDSVEALDITNHIGLCIKSGNVRRSALLVLGQPGDQNFRNAKKDWDAVKSHRHTSNNSIAFRTWDEIESCDWGALVEDNIMYGEPGLVNLALIRQSDPEATGVNPCGEITLRDREACNLAEIFPAKFEDSTDPARAFRLLTRYSLRQRLAPLADLQADTVRKETMRIGIGLGGICDFDWNATLLSEWYSWVRNEADVYAEELGVSRPIAVTTTKPSGTISLLNSSSPGIHSPHAPFYIRRTRIAKNDPMSSAMMEAGVPFEEDIYDSSGYTWVFSFPMKATHTRVTSKTETLREQFKRQATIQKWWSDNSVSATLNFNPENDREELAACLKEYVPQLKSTSCLARSHGYQQAPYEEIDELTYCKMSSYVDNAHPLVHGGDIEIEECSGGVCPIR